MDKELTIEDINWLLERMDAGVTGKTIIPTHVRKKYMRLTGVCDKTIADINLANLYHEYKQD